MRNTMIAALASCEQALQDLASARHAYATAVAAVRTATYQEFAAGGNHERGMSRMENISSGFGLERFDAVVASRARTLNLGRMMDARVEGNYEQTGPEWVENFRAGLQRVLPCLVMVLALLWASPAQAAIAFDAATDGENNGFSTSTLSFSHTTSGSNRLLIVGVAGDGTTDDCSGGGNGVTFNGDAMTLVDKAQHTGQSRWTYAFLLVNPDAGAHTVLVTCGSTHFIGAVAVSYTGTAQTGQPDASNTNSGDNGGGTLTTSVTTVEDNSWTVLLAHDDGGVLTAGTGSTLRVDDAAFSIVGIFDSNGPHTPAGSESMDISGAGARATVIVSIAPDTGGGPGPSSRGCRMLLCGVGE